MGLRNSISTYLEPCLMVPLLNLLTSAKILEQINYHLDYNWASNKILHLGQDGAIAWISKMN